jgi:hypothetical protein
MIVEDLNKMPVGLSAKGKKAYKAIMQVLIDNDALDTGGCKTFYSPAEWKARGEEFCLGAELIVVYDGGGVAPFFNYDYECYSVVDLMVKALDEVGLYSESATCWYSGIYLN